jgi:hypothetical protein
MAAANKYHAPDGRARPAIAERDINQALGLCFADAVGEKALKYLRSITIESIQGPGYDPNVLAHIEGARWLVAIIEKRISDAKENLPHVA